MRKFFGTDGIRGRANIYPMVSDFALKLGKAIATIFKNGNRKHKIVIGKDTRISGYMFENAIVSGICSVGVDAVLLGVLPTPAIAFITKSLRADAGVVISASHNPYYDNGIKFFGPDGYKLNDELELEIEKLIEKDNFDLSPSNIGKAYRIETAIGRYVEYVKSTFDRDIDLKGLKIVIDCANGATYKVAPMAISELGADVIVINDKPNGFNINDGCGAVNPEKLQGEVIKNNADLGISFDGDGDRVIFVDEKGEVVDGDYIMGICANYMNKQGLLNNSTVVATVMSNIGFENSLKREGIKIIRSQVGDRYVLEEMLKGGYNLGGEQSGHIIFSDYNTTGDGLISALQLLKVLVKSGETLNRIKKFIEVYPQKLKNLPVDEKVPLEKLSKLKNVIDEIENELQGDGRVLVRYSGTENKLRIMVEAIYEDKIDMYIDRICEVAIEDINKNKSKAE
ncbi:phosphoglucosamine mutase [Deferribacter desulfuricans SSM1]|uniref:Phosphoglucosamine mutase n=1 Tax=Deferribacter desulfuricans (strain DSM 14783 / JCM 11476 / NBRC 101012 / SSM1) TaxID=639282 RepID=D3PD30_DEFDS|nr:phosphoglucosamine mutase [Deferribacter desulfuricans]BAI80503.1 phosphoglucosamine mutase [Deferribacter desulfuricans SSM1]